LYFKTFRQRKVFR